MARFYSPEDAVDLALLGSDDILKHGKGRLLKWSKHVYNDMNMDTLKIAKRQQMAINKKTNTIDMPCEFDALSSVNVMDQHGVLWPVYRNDKLHDDIVDVSAKKNCACELNCGYELCNLIKGYEAIVSTKSDLLPNGQSISFACVDRKVSDKNGFVYQENQYPKRIYTNGVWTGTIMYTEQIKLCQCEVDNNGCIIDNETNLTTVCNACGIGQTNQIPFGGDANSYYNDPKVDTWAYFCNSRMDWFGTQCGGIHDIRRCNNIYNVTEEGDRLIFPHNFGFGKVVIRWYANMSLKDIKIPFDAVGCFVTGLKWFDVRWNDKKQNLELKYGSDYAKQKWGLFLELNKYRISEQKMMLYPPVHVPSYIDHRDDRGDGFF